MKNKYDKINNLYFYTNTIHILFSSSFAYRGWFGIRILCYEGLELYITKILQDLNVVRVIIGEAIESE